MSLGEYYPMMDLQVWLELQYSWVKVDITPVPTAYLVEMTPKVDPLYAESIMISHRELEESMHKVGDVLLSKIREHLDKMLKARPFLKPLDPARDYVELFL